MRGTATLDILATPEARRIVLDDKDLVIAKITDAQGRPLKWSVGASDEYKGAPLTVEIVKRARLAASAFLTTHLRVESWRV